MSIIMGNARGHVSLTGRGKFVFALLFLPLALLAAQGAGQGPSAKLPELRSLLAPAIYGQLASEGKVVLTSPASKGPGLLPNYQGSEALVSSMAGDKANLLVEGLYAYRRPQPTDAAAELRSLFGTFLSISSLEGIQYYSASRKKMRTFYEQSYRIDGPETRNRLPDLGVAAGALPSATTCYAFQKDLTFGSNLYLYGYRVLPEALLVESTNLTGMTYMGISIISPKGLKVRILVIQSDEAILFYVISAAEAPSIGIVRDKVQDSVSNRAEALYKWFEARQKALGR